MSRDILTRCLFGRIHLGSEMCEHMWEDPEIYQIWTVNQGNLNDWPKEIQKKCLIKEIQTAKRVQISDSPSEAAHVSTHMNYTLFLLINTSLASLLSVFVETFFCKTEGPGPLSLTYGLVARIWCSHCSDPTQYLVGELRSCSIASWGHLKSYELHRNLQCFSKMFGRFSYYLLLTSLMSKNITLWFEFFRNFWVGIMMQNTVYLGAYSTHNWKYSAFCYCRRKCFTHIVSLWLMVL